MLDSRDQRTSEILTKLVNKEIKTKEAMKLLGLSKRQVLRKKKKLLTIGISSIPHGSRGRATNRAVGEKTKDFIHSLYAKEYSGWNFSHFHETITGLGKTDLSLKSVSRILQSKGIHSPQEKKKKKQVHPPRERKESFGEMIQVDASKYQWLYPDPNYYHLHGGIDDASGTITGAHLEEQETIHGYQLILKQTLENYGIPMSWYTDYRTVFQSTKKELTLQEELSGKKLHSTRFGLMMEKLGVEIISTTSPQAKGRIERLWRTFQDRLAKELFQQKITTLKQANAYITNTFIPRFNARFALPINEEKNEFVPLPENFDCNRQLATYQERIIQHHCYLKYQRQYLVILDPKTRLPVHLSSKKPVRLYTLLDDMLEVLYQDQFYPVQVISFDAIKQKLEKDSLALKVVTSTDTAVHEPQIKSLLIKPQYTPAANHPWKKYDPNWLKTRNYNYQRNY